MCCPEIDILSAGAVIDVKHLLLTNEMEIFDLSCGLSISIASIIAYDQLTADVYDNNETFFQRVVPLSVFPITGDGLKL